MAESPLITAESLAALLPASRDVVILDARPDREAYRAGHVAGAVYAGLNTELSAASEPGFDPVRGGRHPLPSIERWAATLGAWGIGPLTRVVVYDALDGSNAATRAWWMHRAAGHERVRVLDGGFHAAVDAGLPMAAGEENGTPRGTYPASAWSLPVFDMGDVDRLRADRGWKLLDVRSEPRYRGETEPIDPVAGHIPGAVNLPFASNSENGRFKSPAALRAMYLDLLGETPPQRLVVHCGSGVTACHTLLALEIAGLPGAALYVGSWSEWCRNPMPVDRSV